MNDAKCNSQRKGSDKNNGLLLVSDEQERDEEHGGNDGAYHGLSSEPVTA